METQGEVVGGGDAGRGSWEGGGGGSRGRQFGKGDT